MDLNSTTLDAPVDVMTQIGNYIRLINLTVSCIGVFTNSILLLVLLLLGRHQCTTYFLLIIMTLCDFLYCLVYASISLTIDSYLNIINHQILCPLSFFLTPFAFTGSTLLLFICLLHLITNYVRRYDTVLGQIGGRLSVVFIFAFVIIRSVLGSTSIELIPDSRAPYMQNCVIDINVSDLVTKVQRINHIFAEVTDILVYIGWILMLGIYVIASARRRLTSPTHSRENVAKASPNVSFLLTKPNQQETRLLRTDDRRTHRQRHETVSSIILFISVVSIVLYLPIMINKSITFELTYREQSVFSHGLILFVQSVQQPAHLLCLAIRFLAFVVFEKRICAFVHRMIGLRIPSETSSSSSSSKKKKQRQHSRKYICRCRCSRQQQAIDSV